MSLVSLHWARHMYRSIGILSVLGHGRRATSNIEAEYFPINNCEFHARQTNSKAKSTIFICHECCLVCCWWISTVFKLIFILIIFIITSILIRLCVLQEKYMCFSHQLIMDLKYGNHGQPLSQQMSTITQARRTAPCVGYKSFILLIFTSIRRCNHGTRSW